MILDQSIIFSSIKISKNESWLNKDWIEVNLYMKCDLCEYGGTLLRWRHTMILDQPCHILSN